jgi:hypothetical protein
MTTLFCTTFITSAEWKYIETLTDSEVLNYLFKLYDSEQKRISPADLASFFYSISQNLQEMDNESQESEDTEDPYKESGVEVIEFGDDVERVDVLIDDDNIMIESNSLKAVRLVSYKFVESGYIILRDLNTEKLFRKDKVTRYLRVFRIVSQFDGLCFS